MSITVEIMYEIGWKLQLDCGEYTPYTFTQEIRIYKSFEKGGITLECFGSASQKKYVMQIYKS